jgi:hypothetical protein
MDVTQFWQLIDQTKTTSKGDIDKQAALLQEAIAKLPLEEIIEYRRIFDKLLRRADRADITDVTEVITGGLGDSGWRDFRAWLIGQGQQVYENVLTDPETLADIVPLEDQPDITAEPLLYVGQIAYEEKTGTDQPIPRVFKSDETLSRGEGLWKSVSSREEFNRRFKEKFPRVWAKFGWDNPE